MENKQKNNFIDLGIAEPILRVLQEEGFTEPTKIQTKTIPLVLDNKDVIGGSKTGSGKTLAFSCGIIQKPKLKSGIRALVLTPTRELAQQVASAFRKFSKYMPLNVLTIYGGVSINPQIKSLPKADVVIATPGRLLDHINRNTIDLRDVTTLVLDEADMMLDMGFLPDVERIIGHLSEKRQTLLFSATIPYDIKSLTQKYMIDPTRVSTETYVDPSKLEQVYYDVKNKQKISLLIHFLKEDSSGRVMVFCNTRHCAEFIRKNLVKHDVKCTIIHGGLTQEKRGRNLEMFHKGKSPVLVCTDVAARGLDIQDVSHIYNYDVCSEPKRYVHRIGRTARAGKDGKAITLLSPRDHESFAKIKALGDMWLQRGELPNFSNIVVDFEELTQKRSNYRGSGARGRPSSGWQRRQSGGQRRSSDGGQRRQFGQRNSLGGEHRRNSGQRNYSDRGQRRQPSGQGRSSGEGQRRHSRSRSSSGEGPRKQFGQRRDSGQRNYSSGGQRRHSGQIKPLGEGQRKQLGSQERSSDKGQRRNPGQRNYSSGSQGNLLSKGQRKQFGNQEKSSGRGPRRQSSSQRKPSRGKRVHNGFNYVRKRSRSNRSRRDDG